MKEILTGLISVFKPDITKWLVRIFVTSGIALIATPIWEPYANAAIENYLGIVIPPSTHYSGWFLVALGLVVYYIGHLNRSSAVAQTGYEAAMPVQVPISDLEILFPSSIPNQTEPDTRKLIRSLKNEIEEYVCNDQIAASGGWGNSQIEIFEYTSGEEPTAIDLREGGIVSTFIALRALRASGYPINSYEGIGKDALSYLLTRQNYQGGFGRFKKSRSGEEVSVSYRHTALALLSLLILDGPSKNIKDGIGYLLKINISDIESDAAPSIAAPIVLLALHMLQAGEWGKSHLTEIERHNVWNKLEELRTPLLEHVESSAKTPDSELWVPYGNSERMIFDSALTTVDFLSLNPEAPPSVISNAILHISKSFNGEGIPYDPSRKIADIGCSLYFATLCFRPIIKSAVESNDQGAEVLQIASSCLKFCAANWGNPEYMVRTYLDTVANGLMINA
ncbi:MAG: hypothetical protein AB2689_02090 [Candidatus Thiodiazotropha taylori]